MHMIRFKLPPNIKKREFLTFKTACVATQQVKEMREKIRYAIFHSAKGGFLIVPACPV